MKKTTHTHYEIQVLRSGTMINYSAERFDSIADARVSALRLTRKSEHYPEGNYVEIRRVSTTISRELVERIEAE